MDWPSAGLDWFKLYSCIRGQLVFGWPEEGGYTLDIYAVQVLRSQPHARPR